MSRPLFLVRNKSNYCMPNQENEESSVLSNDHLPVMKTIYILFFSFFKIASSQWHRCEKGKTFYTHSWSLLLCSHKEYKHRGCASWDIHAFLALLSLNCEDQSSLFLQTLALIVHPQCWHCQIAIAGWLFHHTDASTNLYCFPAPPLPCIFQKECE